MIVVPPPLFHADETIFVEAVRMMHKQNWGFASHAQCSPYRSDDFRLPRFVLDPLADIGLSGSLSMEVEASFANFVSNPHGADQRTKFFAPIERRVRSVACDLGPPSRQEPQRGSQVLQHSFS
jgi:hypothetical protein